MFFFSEWRALQSIAPLKVGLFLHFNVSIDSDLHQV
jgi:hypothetical protein